MAKPNYAFAKHQRDLAKKQKKEEKRQKKADARQDSSSQNSSPDKPAPATVGAPPVHAN